MMAIALVLAAFGTFRLARMLAEEDGPWDVFKHIRAKRADESDWIAKGIRCPLCLGFWIAGVLTLYLALVSVVPWSLWLVCWFGVAGAAVKIKEFWAR